VEFSKKIYNKSIRRHKSIGCKFLEIIIRLLISIGWNKSIRWKFLGISHFDRYPIITICNVNNTESGLRFSYLYIIIIFPMKCHLMQHYFIEYLGGLCFPKHIYSNMHSPNRLGF